VFGENDGVLLARRNGVRLLILIGWFLLAGAFPAHALAQAGKSFVVIVNEANPIQSIDRQQLEAMFLKRSTFWPDQSVVQPVDLRPDSPLRKQFSRSILRRSEMAVRTYWQQRIFTGRGVPPPELASERDVIAYVRGNRGAIG